MKTLLALAAILVSGSAQAHIMSALPPPVEPASGAPPATATHHSEDTAIIVSAEVLPVCTISADMPFTVSCTRGVTSSGPVASRTPSTGTTSVSVEF